MSWLLVPLAFCAMACQDIVCVLMVRAETSGRAHRAALCDVLQDALGLSAAVIAARLAGDYAGTWSGVRLGVWLDSRRSE